MKTLEKWQTVPIKSVYEGLYDGPHATPAPSEAGPVFLGIKNVTDDGALDLTGVRHISEEEFPRWTKRVNPRPGDIVFTYEATLNRYAIVPNGFRGCLGRRMALIRTNPKKVDTRFLHFYFFSKQWREVISSNILTGATVDRIPLTKFPDFPITIPPLPTQRKIAGILSAYDDLIENNLRRIKILEQMAQSLYREWFVHFRFPGHESVKLVDSALGQIPKGWEVKKLEMLYKTSSGGTPSRKVTEYYDNGTIDWVKTGELRDCFILASGEKITDEALKKSSAKLFPANAVLIALYGATIGQLGILSCEAATNQACCAILEINEPFGRAFAYLTLLLRREDIIGMRLGAAQQNISQAVLRDFELICPSVGLLEQFNQRAEPIFDMLLNLQRRNQTLRRTRDHLLPKLLDGSK